MDSVRWCAVFVPLGFIVGCATPTITPVEPPIPTTVTSSVDPALRPFVDVAIADLARRLAIGQEAIAVIEARTMVWPDGGLGCPRPGMVYPQVQQDGTL